MLTRCMFWGFVATLVMTSILAGSQGLGLTRMNLPFLLGTIVTPNRDRAKLYGLALHGLNGIVFARLYMVGFQVWGGACWWKGLAFGAVHSAFLLTCGVTLLPGLHPRMASEQEGPTTRRQLEPPGFLGLHYGARTPLSILLAHLTFGLLLGVSLQGND